MILGVGVDRVDILRIRSLLQQFGPRFIQRVFSPVEAAAACQLADPAAFLAKRFAAKEALVKALGTGFRELKWSEISVENDTLGAPVLSLSGAARTALERRTPERATAKVHLSLCDEGDAAMAFVVIEVLNSPQTGSNAVV